MVSGCANDNMRHEEDGGDDTGLVANFVREEVEGEALHTSISGGERICFSRINLALSVRYHKIVRDTVKVGVI